MNLVYIQGKVISEIDFKFIINSKNISIAIFKVELKNESIITVRAYNEKADYCYRKLDEDIEVIIEGRLNTRLEIICNKIITI